MKTSIRLLIAGLVLAGSMSSAITPVQKTPVLKGGGAPIPMCDPNDNSCNWIGNPPR
jgi:hypothetical protein